MHKLIIPLIVFALSSGCKKANNPNPTNKPNPTPPPASTYTTGIGGVRNWHGYHYYTASGPHFPTPIHEDWSLPDTSFAVTVINDSTVVCMSDTFKYHSSDSVKQIHFFGNAMFNYMYGRGTGTGMAYHYSLDSIVYLKNQDKHGTTDSWVKDDRYYTY